MKKKIHHCLDCKKEIGPKAKRCQPCEGKHKRGHPVRHVPKPILPKYSLSDLNKAKQEWNDNFALLYAAWKCGDTVSHDKYVKAERELYKNEVKIGRALHLPNYK